MATRIKNPSVAEVTPKVISQMSERAQRIIAQAKKEPQLRNINTGKAIVTRKPQATKAVQPKEVKPVKKAVQTLAGVLDELIAKGGDWETLIEKGNAYCKKMHLKTKISKASFSTQIYWRVNVQGRKDYMNGKKVTEKGIELVK